MKHLKKLSVVLMLTTLFSVTFTSCIDNEVSPAVEAIYGAQADLIAAQAGVQDAEATYRLALAANEQANADYRSAQAAQVAVITAGYEADNAFQALQREQQLRELVADTDLAVATAQNALDVADANFQITMNALLAQIEASGVALAQQYAWQYRNAMIAVNTLTGDKVTAEGQLATLQLMLNGAVSWEFSLELLNATKASLLGQKAAKEAEIAGYEAIIADPASNENYSTELQGLRADLLAENNQLNIDLVTLQNDITAMEAEYFGSLTALHTEYDNLVTGFLGKTWTLNAIDGLETSIDAWETANTNLEADYASWDADLAALEAIVVTKLAAKTAATAAQAAAVTAESDANDALVLATALYASYQAAITALATLEASQPTLNSNLAAAVVAQGLSQGAYTAAKINFEGSPSGVTRNSGADGVLGNHNDDGTFTTSYRQILTVAAGPVVTWASATLYPNPAIAPVLGNISPNAWAALASPGDNGLYFDVEADDTVVGTNEAIYNAAVAALDADNIALVIAQDAVADYATDHAAAFLAYTTQRDLYETGPTLAEATATELATNVALGNANTALGTATTQYNTAVSNVATFEAYTKEDILADIEHNIVMIGQAQVNIDGYTGRLAELQVAIDAVLAEIAAANAGGTTDLRDAITVKRAERAAINAEIAANTAMRAAYLNIITAIGAGNDVAGLNAKIVLAEGQLAAIVLSIEQTDVLIAQGGVSVAGIQAQIVAKQALIVSLTQRIANLQAIADKYKALMDAALLS